MTFASVSIILPWQKGQFVGRVTRSPNGDSCMFASRQQSHYPYRKRASAARRILAASRPERLFKTEQPPPIGSPTILGFASPYLPHPAFPLERVRAHR
jgi:hypothetical protein